MNEINIPIKKADCLGNPCSTQTLTIDAVYGVGGRFLVTPEACGVDCFSLIPYDIELPKNKTHWSQFCDDLYAALYRCAALLNCDYSTLDVTFVAQSNLIVITIEGAPFQLLYIDIVGGLLNGNKIYFNLTNC